MSFFSNALQWGLKAASSNQAKQIEMQAIQQGLDKVSGLLKDKVPDYYAPVIEPLLSQIAAHATAAILSKQA